MRTHSVIVVVGLVSACLEAPSCTGAGDREPYYSGGGPGITGLEPISEQGNLGGGIVTILGSGFGSDHTAAVVMFGDRAAEILAVSDGSIQVVAPAGPVSGGPVAVTVGTLDDYTVFGDDEDEPGYTYDIGEDFFTSEDAYLVLRNYRGIHWESWVGHTGIAGTAEFLGLSYPRYHTQDLGFAFATYQGPSGPWVVQAPGFDEALVGFEGSRLEVDDFVIYNHDNDGVRDSVAADTLEPAAPGDPDVLTYEVSELHLCQEPWVDARLEHRYGAEWPVEENFFWTDNADGTVDVTIDFDGGQGVVFSDASSAVDLVLPPQMEVSGTEGFGGGSSPGDWTLSSSGVGTFDACFDDEDDDDRDTTLEDVALRWTWEPVPSSFHDYVSSVQGGGGPIVDIRTHVRITLTHMSIGAFGAEGYPVRISAVVPDDHDYDAATGLASVELPVEIFYQLPTSDVFAGSGFMGQPGYDDPTDPRWGYTFVSVDRITEYRIVADRRAGVGLGGDLIVAYATGDFGLFSYEHPLDGADPCADCVDNDGDGWVDRDDPDCEEDYRSDGSEPAEDELSFGLFSCNDGVDNDGDGHTDWEDEGCEAGDQDESNCSDGVDNDGDGWADELDGECVEGGSEQGTDLWGCSNGIDDDGDLWVDIDDPDCSDGMAEELGFGISGCNDGMDNDGHGDIDASDPYCFYSGEGALTDVEQPGMSSECADGLDNDGDGYVDANDPDCETGSSSNESMEFWTEDFFELIPICYNGTDDDGDGLVDVEDPGCHAEDGEADGFLGTEDG
jgi:hypothetical protein